jgi:hypothetical protein
MYTMHRFLLGGGKRPSVLTLGPGPLARSFQHRPKPHQRSDTHLIALDMKTVRLVWDTELGDRKAGIQLTGGPLRRRAKS